MSNFWSIHYCGKRLYVHYVWYDRYGRALIVCQFVQESSKVKESSLHRIWNADTAFLLSGAVKMSLKFIWLPIFFQLYSADMYLLRLAMAQNVSDIITVDKYLFLQKADFIWHFIILDHICNQLYLVSQVKWCRTRYCSIVANCDITFLQLFLSHVSVMVATCERLMCNNQFWDTAHVLNAKLSIPLGPLILTLFAKVNTMSRWMEQSSWRRSLLGSKDSYCWRRFYTNKRIQTCQACYLGT